MDIVGEVSGRRHRQLSRPFSPGYGGFLVGDGRERGTLLRRTTIRHRSRAYAAPTGRFRRTCSVSFISSTSLRPSCSPCPERSSPRARAWT